MTKKKTKLSTLDKVVIAVVAAAVIALAAFFVYTEVLATNPCLTDCEICTPQFTTNGSCHCHGECGTAGCRCDTSHAH
ncbi:MAG: hypothetical protein LBI27_08525 [Clostridiales bacterium]|jgi:hypothetical protein|nr:hypothetical protein [Clostridiales bacterium]